MRQGDKPATQRPTLFYYAAQMAPPRDSVGPGRFFVPLRPPLTRALLDANVVSPSYFDGLGVDTVEGDVFPDAPAPKSCRVGVINREAAELFFGGNAIGGAVIDSVGRRTEIIGVVDSPLLRRSQRRPEPAIYFPMAQDFVPRMTLMLSARDPDQALMTSVRRQLGAVRGGTGEVIVTTLDAHLSRNALASERIATMLVGVSTVIALALGMLGVYGVVSESTRQRRREIALRLALGAQSWRILGQVLGEAVRLASAGTLAGLLASFVVARWLRRMAGNVGELNVLMWVSVPLLLLVAVVIAAMLPARRALAVDPLLIMRDS
jgi:ABC-type antimicrobial peptide transport system permease subunit